MYLLVLTQRGPQKTAVGWAAVHSGIIQIGREGNATAQQRYGKLIWEFVFIFASTFVEVFLKFCYGAAQCKIFIQLSG